jgi:proteasome alpha subunit
MKAAFEQVYGAPFLARLIFAELGPTPEDDLFLRVEYDGAISTNGSAVSQTRQNFAVLSATPASTAAMETFLKNEYRAGLDLGGALGAAVDAWSVGHMTAGPDGAKEPAERDAIIKHRQEQLATTGIEAAVLERNAKAAIRYRALSDDEARAFISN